VQLAESFCPVRADSPEPVRAEPGWRFSLGDPSANAARTWALPLDLGLHAYDLELLGGADRLTTATFYLYKEKAPHAYEPSPRPVWLTYRRAIVSTGRTAQPKSGGDGVILTMPTW
jgi:hypothetical protein